MREDLYERIGALRAGGRRAVLAIVIAHRGASPRKDAAKMLLGEDGSRYGSVGGGLVEEEVCREAARLLESGKSRLMTFDLSGIDHDERALVCGGSMQIYLEAILPDPSLFIFGAGHVASAVAAAAGPLGFKITILDDREKYARAGRFPDAEVRLVGDWETELGRLAPPESSYFFIATQRPKTDRLCLRFAAGTSARYIGMLGSLAKTDILFDAMQREGVAVSELERVCIPAGLDIDSETPEEIAVSVAAELVAARKNLDLRRMREAVRGVKSGGAGARSAARNQPSS
jgi:xanthine dehydrogenase accessory factor